MKCPAVGYPASGACRLVWALFLGLGLVAPAFAADSPFIDDPAPPLPAAELREGGVLAESYQYHRAAAPGSWGRPNIAQPAGWYGYGFAVPSYRWGWFGAERYYPRVVWHRGYYNECCRWGYRHGY